MANRYAETNLPENYELLRTIDLTKNKKENNIVTILSLVLLVVAFLFGFLLRAPESVQTGNMGLVMVAALFAVRLCPAVREYLFPSHASQEVGYAAAMHELGLEPWLLLEMRLGEGSGAALAMPIVEAACAMYHRMGMLAASNIVLPKG